MKTIGQIRSKIHSLIKRLEDKPIIENFGAKEQYQLNDFIGDIWEYPYFERNTIIQSRASFNNWCMNYEGKK